jgi:oligopeptide/dipeptide ABC transporter ATP-binding protein
MTHMDQEKANLVEVRDLTVTYSPEIGVPIRAVDGVSIDIRPAEVVGILGESGSGKSTLASAMLRLLPLHASCEAGSLTVSGTDLMKMDLMKLSESRLRAIRGRVVSMIPQDPALSLNPVMTAGSQVSEVLRAHLPLPAEQRRERVMELLREVGFSNAGEIYTAYPHQLSGGQRQRIAIAQAVSCRPALLIADEPTSKLDAPLQTEIIALLSRIRKQHGTAILFISHDPALFAGFADRIAVMYAGRIVEVGSSAQIFARPFHPYTQALLRLAKESILALVSSPAPAALARLSAIDGESPNPDQWPPGCRYEPRCSERMEICSRCYPSQFIPEPSRPVNCFKYGE